MPYRPNRLRAAALAAAAVLMSGPWAAAYAPGDAAAAPAPATVPASGVQAMQVVVQEVVGRANVSVDDGKSWQPAKAGMTVAEGAQFRTGVKSSVTCTIPPDQTFKIESLSTLRVSEAAKRGNKVKTDLVLKYGAASYGIEAAGAEHDATIRTPSSTLAVRGTIVRVSDQAPFSPTAESFTGRAVYRTAQRETRLGGTRYTVVRADQGSAAETAMNQSVVDPSAARARTESDARLIAEQQSRGGIVSFDARAGISVVRGGAGPTSDADLAASLPGRLDFVLRWTGNADLNLIVDDRPVNAADIARGKTFTYTPPLPAGLPDVNIGQESILHFPPGFKPQELLYPGFGLNTSVTGGQIPFDHRGGPNGGQEIAYWSGSYPQGVFGVGVLPISGGETSFKLNAFLDGKPITLYGFDALGNRIARFTTYSSTVEPHGGDGVIALVPNSPYQESIRPSADDPVVMQALAAVRFGTNAASSAVAPTPVSPAALLAQAPAARVARGGGAAKAAAAVKADRPIGPTARPR